MDETNKCGHGYPLTARDVEGWPGWTEPVAVDCAHCEGRAAGLKFWTGSGDESNSEGAK
jgi:hypothetical protein